MVIQYQLHDRTQKKEVSFRGELLDCKKSMTFLLHLHLHIMKRPEASCSLSSWGKRSRVRTDMIETKFSATSTIVLLKPMTLSSC